MQGINNRKMFWPTSHKWIVTAYRWQTQNYSYYIGQSCTKPSILSQRLPWNLRCTHPSDEQSPRMDFTLRLPIGRRKHQMIIILTNPTSDIWILRLTWQTCWCDFVKTGWVKWYQHLFEAQVYLSEVNKAHLCKYHLLFHWRSVKRQSLVWQG